MVEDDGKQFSNPGACGAATSAEPKSVVLPPHGSHPGEEPNKHHCFSTPTITEPSVKPLKRLTCPGLAPPQCEGAHGPVVIADDLEDTAPIPPIFKRQGRRNPLRREEEEEEEDEEEEWEEWEIAKIVGKRRMGNGAEYKVRWKDTWLPECELGKARRLLRKFEKKRRTRQRCRAF